MSPQPEIIIRPMQPDEVEEAVRFWHETRRATFADLPAVMAKTFEDDYEKFTFEFVDRYVIWLAVRSEEIVGILVMGWEFLSQLFVLPAMQRQGIGSQLLAKAWELSPNRISLGTLERNTPARRFWEKHGFRSVGTTIDLETYEPTILYEKQVSK